MEQFSKFIGLDVHKETIAASVAPREDDVRFLGEIPNTQASMIKLVKQLSKGSERLSFCFTSSATLDTGLHEPHAVRSEMAYRLATKGGLTVKVKRDEIQGQGQFIALATSDRRLGVAP